MSDYPWFRPLPFPAARLPNAREPSHVRALGDTSNVPFGIYFSQETAQFVNSFIQIDKKRPLTGILVGYAAKSSERPFVVITGAIEAKGATIKKGIVHFSDRTWQYMEKIWHREYPNTLVIGWFRSDPQRGTRLTTYDQFTQHRLFAHTWQIALMIDPHNETSQFYYWADERLVSCDSFFIFSDKQNTSYVSTLVALLNALPDSASISVSENVPYASTTKKRTVSYLSLLCILLLLLGACSALPWLTNNLPGTTETLRNAQKQLQAITHDVQLAKRDQQRFRADIAYHTVPLPTSNTFEYNRNNTTDSFAPQVQSFTTTSDVLADSHLIDTTDRYVVKQGDTLWEISHKIFGNPYAYRWIAELNNIRNPDIIHPGMSLKVESND